MLWWLHFHSYVWYAVIIITMAWNLQFRWMIVNVHAYSMAHSPNNPWPTLFIYLPSCGHYANSRGRRIVEQDVIYILTTVGSDDMRSWGGAILRSLQRKCSFFLRKEAKKKRPSSHERYKEIRPHIGRIYLYPLDDAIDFPVIYQGPVVQTLDSAIHRMNHSAAYGLFYFRNTYPLDSDLSGG